MSDFQNLLTRYCCLHQKFAHKKSGLHQLSRNNNAESQKDGHSHSRNSTRRGSMHPMLVPGTQCYEWTKPDALQLKWKNDHSTAIPLAAKHTLFLFFRWKVHNMWCYFYGLGHKLTGCVCLEAATGLLAVIRLE